MASRRRAPPSKQPCALAGWTTLTPLASRPCKTHPSPVLYRSYVTVNFLFTISSGNSPISMFCDPAFRMPILSQHASSPTAAGARKTKKDHACSARQEPTNLVHDQVRARLFADIIQHVDLGKRPGGQQGQQRAGDPKRARHGSSFFSARGARCPRDPTSSDSWR
jgi:hypothetical protein